MCDLNLALDGLSPDEPVVFFIDDIKKIIAEKEDETLVDIPKTGDCSSPAAQIANNKLNALRFVWYRLHELNAAPRYNGDTALTPVFSSGSSPEDCSYSFCPSCGLRIGKRMKVFDFFQSEGGSFCTNCGTRIDWETIERTEITEITESEG